jgi:hypothetical protein
MKRGAAILRAIHDRAAPNSWGITGCPIAKGGYVEPSWLRTWHRQKLKAPNKQHPAIPIGDDIVIIRAPHILSSKWVGLKVD